MKDSNQLINQVLSNPSETQSTEPQLTIGDKDLVNWFFLRLETVYAAKFWSQFSDEKTVLLTKREWAGNITKYTREDLHTAIEFAKSERERGNEEYKWPDIAVILGSLKNRISPDGGNSGAYVMISDPKHPSYQDPKRIESDSYVSKRKQAGRSALDSMKGMFDDEGEKEIPKLSNEEVLNLIEQEKKDAGK